MSGCFFLNTVYCRNCVIVTTALSVIRTCWVVGGGVWALIGVHNTRSDMIRLRVESDVTEGLGLVN